MYTSVSLMPALQNKTDLSKNMHLGCILHRTTEGDFNFCLMFSNFPTMKTDCFFSEKKKHLKESERI